MWAAVGLTGLAVLVGADPQGLPRIGTGPPTPPARAVAALPPPAFEADLLRSCELAASAATLGEESRPSRVLLGLASHNCGAALEAVTLLRLEPDPAADLEDWRLYALAEASIEAGELDTARAAVDALLLDHGDSPLRPRALELSARIALDAGDPDRALERVRAAREIPLAGPVQTELDVIAWQAALALEDPAEIEREAHRLLLYAPIEAIELGVDDQLAPSGPLDFSRYLSDAELIERARRLYDLDLVDEALETLDAVSMERRDLAWRKARARGLVEKKRGSEAYELLESGAAPEAPDLELSWLSAEAALEAATVRRGRSNLPSSKRDEMRSAARVHLREIAERGGDPDLLVPALRRLYDELTTDDADLAVIKPVLTRLTALEPRDYTGARYIWRLGWNEFVAQRYDDAIAFWSELEELYPWTSFARSGRYWTARSYEALGDSARATALLEQIAAAPATDYYRKHALIRLGRGADEPPPPPSATIKNWPTDPALARAARLSDMGIDRLGMIELDLVAGGAAEPAVEALRSRILARQGLRRDSIQALWGVFPVLGTANQMEVPDDALRMYYPIDFVEVVERFAADNGLPVPLLLAMIRQESAFDIQARSWAGARGLMQVMPATGRELAQSMGLSYSREKLDDPSFSVQLGSRYFRQMLDMFDGNLELALAGYNAGPYRIRKMVAAAGSSLEPDRFLEGLPIEESKTYVKRVVLFANSYRQLYPDIG